MNDRDNAHPTGCLSTMKRFSLDGGSSTSPDTRFASSANHSMEPTL